jgi:hypothetical protein
VSAGKKFVPYTSYTYVPTLGADGQWRIVAEVKPNLNYESHWDERIQTFFDFDLTLDQSRPWISSEVGGHNE